MSTQTYPDAPAAKRENRLTVKGLSVSFGGFVAVDQVDLTVGPGETHVIIGPNGAGKTTLLDLITGKTKPTYGTAQFRDHYLQGKNTALICGKYHVGRKFQGPNIFANLTVEQNMQIALMGNESIFRCLFRRKSAEEDQKTEDCLRKINLLEYKDTMAASLSHGQKQWLEIGMVILQDAQLVVLDEPTAGMTADETFKTGQMILELLADKTVLVIEHDMDFVRQIAEKVTVLNQGSVLAEGTFEEVEKNPDVIRVYLKQDTLEEAGREEP